MEELYRSTDRQRLVAAVPSSVSLPPESYRDEFRRDYARLLHSAAFRRLQGKMQLFPALEGDYFRNRLTHSLEVAQIAKSIAIKLNAEAGLGISTDLVEFAGLAHDLGHPPFGHEGEDQLDQCMREYGGFEGNAQTLRILARLEKKQLIDETLISPISNGNDNRAGLNLTYRALASVIKYDCSIPRSRAEPTTPVKGYYETENTLVEAIKRAVGVAPGVPFRTIECQIMDMADDIAYSTYDLEDALKSGLVHMFDILALEDRYLEEIADSVNRSMAKPNCAVSSSSPPISAKEVGQILESVLRSTGILNFDDLSPESFGFNIGAMHAAAKDIGSNGYLRTTLTSHLVGQFIREVKVSPNQKYPAFSRVYMEREAWLQVEVLKHLAFQFLINTPRWKIVAKRAREIITRIFGVLTDNHGYELLPSDFKALYLAYTDKWDRTRVICDYIACMTDTYAVNFYARLRSETPQSIFKPF